MVAFDPIYTDVSGMMLRLAGETGQVSLALSGDAAGARASVDQHVSEIRDTLASAGRPLTQATLLSYAAGFVEAAVARGWWPPHRAERDPWQDEDDAVLDWESLRLAAVCRMFIETQGLSL